MFLVKYDANGSVQWAKSAGGTDMDEANSIYVDSKVILYVTGYFESSSITFGSTILTNLDTNNSLIIFLGEIRL